MVYIHYQDKRDSNLADDLVRSLTDSGYRVPGKELVVQRTSGDVRFFHLEERDQADHIARLVQEFAKKRGRDLNLDSLFAGRTFPNVPRGLFEVWIPASTSQP